MIIRENILLADILWYKIGGVTRYLLEVETEDDVAKAMDFIEKQHIERVFICGLGSNLIFSDEYFAGAVIRIATKGNSSNTIRLEKDGMVEAFGGEVLDNLIQFSLDKGLVGLQWAGGLPGTVGAGVRGNVGAFGGEIEDRFVSARVLEREAHGFSIKVIQNSDFRFSYRHSVIKDNKNFIVLSARFDLQPVSKEELEKARQVYAHHIDYRRTHHPLEYPTCGSVFKNVSKREEVENVLAVWPDVMEKVQTNWHGKVSMGYIIHRLGLTGYRVGKMQVSEKHSNFIINLGGAKAADVKSIITEIQNRVRETFGFTPEVEVEIVA